MTWRTRSVCLILISCSLLLVLAPGAGPSGDTPTDPPSAPVIPGGIPSHREISCPPGYIANRVRYAHWSTSEDRFEIRVEVCVTRDGDVDTYAYVVSNHGFVERRGGRDVGIVRFDAPAGAGLRTVSDTGPAHWTYLEYVSHIPSYGWEAPDGDPGIEIGESAIFTVSFEGPTGPGAGDAYVQYNLESAVGPADAVDRAIAVESLAPRAILPEAPPLALCPEGHVAYDVGYGIADPPPAPGFGEVRVEECVTREAGVDTYTYTVANLSFYHYPFRTTLNYPLYISDFSVPNPAGLEAVSVTSPSGWAFDSDATDTWHWSVQTTWWGTSSSWDIGLGESAVFSFSVEGPTEDGPLEVRAEAQSALLPDHLPGEWRVTDGVTILSTGPHRQMLGRGTGPGTVAEPIPELAGCPDGHIAYDVGYGTAASFGEVRVEQCVTREGDVDTYTYTVTNLTYVYPHAGERYGIGDFSVPRSIGISPRSVTTPAGWDFDSAATDKWHWSLPEGSIGIWPGDSVVFAFSVAGPTADGPLDVRAIPQFPRPPVPMYYIEDCTVVVPSTGPHLRMDPFPVLPPTEPSGDLRPPEECPDLVIDSVELECTCGWTPQQEYLCDITAEVTVRNQGNVDAGLFMIAVSTDDGNARAVLPSLAAGASRRIPVRLDSMEQGCPIECTIQVDVQDHVDECNEENNTLVTGTCCQ